MKFLFTCIPGSGHFHPMVPLAREMVRRNHAVAFATSEPMRTTVTRLGHEFFPIGPEWLENSTDAQLEGFGSLVGASADRQLAYFVEVASRGTTDDLLRVCERWQPDAIVREATEYSAWVVADRLGLPHVVQSITARLPRPVMRLWIGNPLARLREDAGLEPDPELGGFYGRLYLDGVPPSLQPPGIRPLGTAQSLRPVVFDQSGEEEVPDWFNELPSRPTVYATLGTVFNRTPRIFELLIEALALEQVNLVMTVGRDGDPGRFGRLPANVRVERYVPQSLILGHCAAVVTHGGYNTVVAALQHGVPLYCIPLSADHPFNAKRIVETGAGLSAAYDPNNAFGVAINPSDLDVDSVRRDIRRLLQEPEFTHAAVRLKTEIEAMPGPGAAAGRLEKMSADAF